MSYNTKATTNAMTAVPTPRMVAMVDMVDVAAEGASVGTVSGTIKKKQG
jgi:hypothetical protein